MAELAVEGDELVLRLSGVEKAESVHGDLRVAMSAVRGVDVLEDAHEMTKIKTGFKVGTRLPGWMSVAVVRRRGRKMFVAVHHDTPRGVRVRLAGVSCNDWIVGPADPESVIARLNWRPEG